jgi:hypothetical protein
MLLPDPDLDLEMGFMTPPPTSVYANDSLQEPICVWFFPCANHHTALSPRKDFTPWVPDPLDRLHFKCEFIADGAGSSKPEAVCPFPDCTHDVIYSYEDDELLGPLGVRFKAIRFSPRIVPKPGNYILQVTGSILRVGIASVVLTRISSPIKVLR